MDNKKVTYQAAAFAALLAFVGILIQLVATGQLAEGTVPQPYAISAEAFPLAINNQTQSVLLFFAGDTLFPASYLLVFIGLYLRVRDRAKLLGLLGLGFGVLTGLLDFSENAFYITYALLAETGTALSDPAIVLIYAIATLKWTAASVTLYAFALAFPRETLLEKVMVGLMFAFMAFGVLSTAITILIHFRGLFFLIGMPVFAAYFWRLQRQLPTADPVASP